MTQKKSMTKIIQKLGQTTKEPHWYYVSMHTQKQFQKKKNQTKKNNHNAIYYGQITDQTKSISCKNNHIGCMGARIIQFISFYFSRKIFPLS